MSGEPIPEDCFLHELESLGAFNGEKRWRSLDRKRLFTWDSLHGEVEVFNKRGMHLGVKDCQNNFIKPAVKGRRIYV